MRERTLTTAFAVACALLSLCGDRCGAAPRGYLARPCGFDMNRNGIIGEAADRLVADGLSADPDGDGVNEDILYVDSAAGSDTTGSGTAGNPYRTIQKALDVADGPADGAEDIICISGVFREQLTLKQSGVAGYYTRDGFQFPRNPTMIVGWDRDGDGQYPPYDPDETAVLDGNVGGSNLATAFATIGTRSYVEIAHLTVRNYGSATHTTCGAFRLFRSGSAETHVYVHDVEMYAINRAVRDTSARIVFSFWGGPFHHVAVTNSLVDEFGSYFCRGAPRQNSGPFRFRHLTLKMLGDAPDGWVEGWKIWGNHSGMEIIDNIIDANPRAWNPWRFTIGVLCAQGAQDWTIRNNEFIDSIGGITLQPYSSGYNSNRSLNNIVIDRNIIRNTYPGWTYGAFGIKIQGGDNAVETTEDVVITNNFISFSTGMRSGIQFEGGNNAGPQGAGTITIAGNTFYGSPSGAAIFLDDRRAYPVHSWDVRNNIIANVRGSYRNVRTDYAPTNWVANGNVYDGDYPSFKWNNANVATLGAWQTVTGQDAGSKAGKPNFVAPAAGDLHLDPNDTVARGFGVDITDITTWDFDGDARDPGNPTAGADVEGASPDIDPPTILAWSSGATHGHGAGEALLAIPPAVAFSEPRSSGVGKLVVQFSEPMDPVSFTPASVRIAGLDVNGLPVDLGGVTIGASMRGGETVGEITFTPPLPDHAKYAVRISGATDVAGNEFIDDGGRIVTALCGYVSGDLRVNATDFSRVRSARTRSVDAGDSDQVRADVSTDGRVNASDLSRIRARRGNDARGIADPSVAP